MRGGGEPEQKTEQGTIEPTDAHHFWHEFLVWSSSIGGSGVLIALIGVWGNRALKRRRKDKDDK